MKTENEHFSNYLLLRAEIDSIEKDLSKEHTKHMKCKAGCSDCCMDYNIFPIEFYYILDSLKKKNIEIDITDNSKEESCAFLKSNVCEIYEERPIICRTHGLPLVFMNDSNEWELSACELNFTEFDFEEFTLDNTFEQDKFNSKLFMLNKDFISELKEKRYNETDLIPIKELINHL